MLPYIYATYKVKQVQVIPSTSISQSRQNVSTNDSFRRLLLPIGERLGFTNKSDEPLSTAVCPCQQTSASSYLRFQRYSHRGHQTSVPLETCFFAKKNSCMYVLLVNSNEQAVKCTDLNVMQDITMYPMSTRLKISLRLNITLSCDSI